MLTRRGIIGSVVGLIAAMLAPVRASIKRGGIDFGVRDFTAIWDDQLNAQRHQIMPSAWEHDPPTWKPRRFALGIVKQCPELRTIVRFQDMSMNIVGEVDTIDFNHGGYYLSGRVVDWSPVMYPKAPDFHITCDPRHAKDGLFS